MAVNGPALAALGTGVVLVWSAVENQSILTTIQDVVSGKKPKPGPMSDNTPAASSSSGGATSSDAPAAPANVSGNVALGKLMAAAYGWGTGSNWNSLYALWERESGWSNTAENSSSGAYGIAQALGHGPTNQYPAGAANPPTSSAAAQIKWGLGYIKDTYGNPNAAWAHEQSEGWY
jgi:hypothetical protein